MSESYIQGAESELDGSQRIIAGVNPFEPYQSALESISAAGGSAMQIRGIQVPLWTLPLAPQRILVPQRKYGIKTSSKRGFHPEPPIKFDVGGQNGMLLEDAMNERYEGLVGRDDGMFLGCNCTAISLRIEVYTFSDVLSKLVVSARFVDDFFDLPLQWPKYKAWNRHVCASPIDLEKSV